MLKMESTNFLDENMDIGKLKVPDLKRELKARGLSSTGNKNELMERLQNALKRKMEDSVSTECVDDLEEDLLNDDDDEHLDSLESGITDLESPIDEAVPQKPQKRKSEEGNQDGSGKHAKKVILIRKSSSSEIEPENELNQESQTSISPETKKVIKLSELSAKERLEMRSKKFGVPLPPDAKKTVRAERFGSSPGVNTTKLVTTGSAQVNVNVDTLKKRAERFGSSVSSVMTKLSNQERLEKRKQRFGLAATINGSSQTDKAKERLERFKTVVK